MDIGGDPTWTPRTPPYPYSFHARRRLLADPRSRRLLMRPAFSRWTGSG